MTEVSIPAGTTYVVSPKKFPYGLYCFGKLENVVEFLAANSLAFQCEVIRVAGDVLVWPIHTQGGSA
jgi:hypothetical protein